MRLLGVHVVGEQVTELVHLGLIAMMAEAGADLFNRTCFNYPTLGDLYKYATYAAMLKRDGLVVDDSGQLPNTDCFVMNELSQPAASRLRQRSSHRPRGTAATLTECKNVCIARWLLSVI